MIPKPINVAQSARTSAALGSVSPATVRIIPRVTAGESPAAARASAPATPASTVAPGPVGTMGTVGTVAAGPTSAAPAGTVTSPDRATTQPRTTNPVAAYFGLFRPCSCGHSSAWHNGAFGDAWRAGEQVRGRCEASLDEGTAALCRCQQFHELAG